MDTYAKLRELDKQVREGATTLARVVEELRQLRAIVQLLRPEQIAAATAPNDAQPEPEPVATPELVRRKRGRPPRS